MKATDVETCSRCGQQAFRVWEYNGDPEHASVDEYVVCNACDVDHHSDWNDKLERAERGWFA